MTKLMAKLSKKAEQKNCSALSKTNQRGASVGARCQKLPASKISIAADLPQRAPRPDSQLAFFEINSETQKNLTQVNQDSVVSNVSRKTPENEQKPTKTGQIDRFGNLTESFNKTLTKRAKAKTFTNAFLFKLIDLNSPLKPDYWDTWHCSSILQQSGKKITSTYCNKRWCIQCNRIRIARLIIAYRDVLENLPDKQFVTLTVPNISGNHNALRAEINRIQKTLREIQNQTFRKRETLIKGIRKTECTYNAITGDFHPHLHLIVAGTQIANDLRSEWLKKLPKANAAAQHIRPADDNSFLELFKYFTKIISKGKKRHIYPAALDTIFQAMKGLRTFQPIGIAKDIPEDIQELEAEIYQDLVEQETLWHWIDHDWIDRTTGELRTGYTPSKKDQEFLNEISS